jgi:hypothetical protein
MILLNTTRLTFLGFHSSPRAPALLLLSLRPNKERQQVLLRGLALSDADLARHGRGSKVHEMIIGQVAPTSPTTIYMMTEHCRCRYYVLLTQQWIACQTWQSSSHATVPTP